MNRINFIIDGFNLYHSLREAGKYLAGASTKWLDIKSLVQSYLPHISKDAVINNVYYFTALAHHTGPRNVHKHRKYIRCLKETGVICEENRFKEKEITCPNCASTILRHEEKETDVAVAAKLIEIYMKNECESAVIVSGDTDLVPIIKLAKDVYPGKITYFIFPYRRKNKELGQLVDGNYFLIKPTKYINFQFKNPFILSNGKRISKPRNW